MTLAHTLGRFWRRGASSAIVVPPSVNGPAYELFMGTSVDTATGHTTFALHSEGVRYWVNPETGNDAYDGLSYQYEGGTRGPKATFAAGWALWVSAGRNGKPDQLMVSNAVPQVFTFQQFNMTGRSGMGVQYPKVLRSYDPADPLNEAKYGLKQAVIVPLAGAKTVFSQFFNCAYVAIQGLQVDGSQSLGLKLFNPNSRYLQYENVSLFNGPALILDRQAINGTGVPTQPMTDADRFGPFYLRHVGVGWCYYTTGSFAVGIHADATVTGGLVLDRCVVASASRPYGQPRDWVTDPTRAQNVYLKNSPGMVLRGCASADAMTTGFQLRSDATIEYCVADTCGVGIQLGGDDQFWFNSPLGVASAARNNWVSGASWLTSSTNYERAMGIANLLGRVRDGRHGVEIEDNIISNGRPVDGDPRYNAYPFFDNALTPTVDAQAAAAGITQAQWDSFTSVSRKRRNIVYNWAKPTLGTPIVDYNNPGSPVPAYYDTEHADDLIEGAYPALPAGCSAVTAADFVDPARTVATYAAQFGQTRDEFWRAAVLDPTNPRYHGYALTAYARAGFARV